MRRDALALALLSSSCLLDRVDYTGKSCAEGCPGRYTCEADRCVPDGGSLCQLVTGARACFDFEDGGLPDAGVTVRGDGGSLKVDGVRPRFGSWSMHATVVGDPSSLQRLELPLPDTWKAVRLSFDVFPSFAPLTGMNKISLGEVLCQTPLNVFSGLWLFYESASGSVRFVARTDFANSATVLMPQLGLDRWSRVALEAQRTPLGGTVKVDGEVAATQPLVPCSGRWRAVVGTSGSGVGNAWYDNVVLEVDE